MEAFCVVLDTNVWRSELLLNTPNGAALLFLVKRCNAKIGLPRDSSRRKLAKCSSGSV